MRATAGGGALSEQDDWNGAERVFYLGGIDMTVAGGEGAFDDRPASPPDIRNVLKPSFRIAFPLVLKASMIKSRNLPPF
jgi:hypothetical protein